MAYGIIQWHHSCWTRLHRVGGVQSHSLLGKPLLQLAHILIPLKMCLKTMHCYEEKAKHVEQFTLIMDGFMFA
jgi:hypothetical protein